MIKKFKFYFTLVFFILLIGQNSLIGSEKNYKIIKLVNEHVITNFDLEQRIKFYSFLNNIMINEENLENVANKILSEMVDELLQLEKIREYKIDLNNINVDDYIKKAYLKEDISLETFNLSLEKNNLDINILRKSISIKVGWNELAGRLFYRNSKINQIDLHDLMKNNQLLTKIEAEDILIQKLIRLRAKKLLRDIRTEANIENR
tara:strand:+ start:804 stop:1418 length:615 start_codon:yes stop_codon:yes gene_type:complete